MAALTRMMVTQGNAERDRAEEIRAVGYRMVCQERRNPARIAHLMWMTQESQAQDFVRKVRTARTQARGFSEVQGGSTEQERWNTRAGTCKSTGAG
eukprot:700335-Rhodomonas_salina.2